MKKIFVVMLISLYASTCFADTVTETAEKFERMTPEEQARFMEIINHPVHSKQDDNVKNGVQGGDILKPQPAKTSTPRTKTPASNLHPQKGDRKYQAWDDVKDIWYEGALRQLTNWQFSKESVKVELIDKNGKRVGGPYTIKPYKPGHPEAGYTFGRAVQARTQIVVPEGCVIHGNPQYVNSDEDPAAFGSGEIMYFESKDPGAGFTIFPYDNGKWRQEVGL